MSSDAGFVIPSPFRYHSLATSTYSLSAGGRPSFGSTTIAPYIPFAMWARTGLVPQWYMKTPGSPAVKRKVNDSPGATSLKATFGAIRAAWKSIECGIAPPFVSVISTVWPSRTCTTGPGAPWPSKAQVLYFTPGATSTVMSFSVMWTLTRSPAGTGFRAASYGVCASASSAAFSGTTPANVVRGSAVLWSVAWSWLAVDAAGAACRPPATCAATALASSRASSAAYMVVTAATAKTPTAIPSRMIATSANWANHGFGGSVCAAGVG